MKHLLLILLLFTACSNPVSEPEVEYIELTGMVLGFDGTIMILDTYDKVYRIEMGEEPTTYPLIEITILVRQEGDTYYLVLSG